MILIYGIPSENPIQLLTTELDKLCFPYLLLNQRDFEKINIQVKVTKDGPTGYIEYNKLVYPIQHFTGVYLRPMDPLHIPEVERSNKQKEMADQAMKQSLTLWELTDIMGGNIVNRRRMMASNGSKPFQALLIHEVGLKTPETLISNNPEDILAFKDKHNGEIIYKSISGIRSIVKKFSKEDEDRLKYVQNCPTQFQQCVAGTDYRVHVIGEKTFATRILSEATDYRYANRDGKSSELEATELGSELEAKLISLNKKLGLSFSGIDLRIDEQGEVHCFEANPSPAYSYYQSQTGQKISHSLAEYLAKPA